MLLTCVYMGNFIGNKILRFTYLHPEFEENLKSYKYQGSDKSLFYNYLLSPFGNFCVKYLVPETLANRGFLYKITFFGLLCVLVPHFIFLMLYPLSLAEQVPSWLCILTGILHLLYMNFDNIDGKQARKTDNASPLGLLFDHGCDSLIVMLQGLSLCITLQCGNGIMSLGVYLIGCLPFYFTTLEEYFTKEISLPIVNGPSEGCLLIASFFIFSGIVGSEWWRGEVPGIGIQRNVLMFIVFLIASLITVYLKAIYKVNKLKEGLLSSLFFLYMLGTSLIVVAVSDQAKEYLRIVMYILGFGFAKLVSHLQIAHISASPFRQFRFSLFLVFTLLLVNSATAAFLGKALIEEYLLLFLMLAVVLIVITTAYIAYGHLVALVIKQMTSILGIRCFVVKAKDPSNYNVLLPPV